MQRRAALVSSTALLAAVACSTAFSATWVQPRAPSLAATSGVCASFSILSGDYAVGPGATNGVYGTPEPGEKFTVTFSGSGSGSFRVVGDPGGTVTLAGPTDAPGTLTYIVSGAPSGAPGVGFYFDSGAGSLTLQASCLSPTTRPAPALGARGLALLGGLLGLAGMTFARRWRRGT